ncbi:MAG: GNAT family N-acetyltransferase [Candidatus Levybacteria bacterium]|nr:GNAT family N-acetyltransferase [Candidatus Levybacteria bacterium]
MELISPSSEYKDQFIDAVKEYQAIESDDRRDIYEINTEELEIDFPTYLKKLNLQSQGENLPEGYVPVSTFWLVDNHEFIGRVSIRHRLTPDLMKIGGHIGYDIRPSKRKMGYGKKILELALLKAKELGIERVLATCIETNIGSKKIIESNGGVFEERIPADDGKSARLRYWINL